LAADEHGVHLERPAVALVPSTMVYINSNDKCIYSNVPEMDFELWNLHRIAPLTAIAVESYATPHHLVDSVEEVSGQIDSL
jgi:hypothetical protein